MNTISWQKDYPWLQHVQKLQFTLQNASIFSRVVTDWRHSPFALLVLDSCKRCEIFPIFQGSYLKGYEEKKCYDEFKQTSESSF